MKKLVTLLSLSLFAATAIAQTNATPPSQPPAGNPGKLITKKKPATDTPVATDAATPATPVDRRAARKAKRDAKVGDKPIN